MGVPGLWRIIDMGSKPINLEEHYGMKIAIDIHPYLNKLLHGNNSSNWVFFIMKNLFSVLHFNIKIIITGIVATT